MRSQSEKGKAFRALHARDHAFVIPNPWDIGSAKLLEKAGFEALATTSAGFARSIGKEDHEVTRDEKLAHAWALCAAVDLPISADLENGFGDDLSFVAETIRLAAEAGLVGGSIEDYSAERGELYDIEFAVDRIRAAVEACGKLGLISLSPRGPRTLSLATLTLPTPSSGCRLFKKPAHTCSSHQV